jgi:hypothetical protein
MKKIQLAVMAGALILAVQSHATFSFNYSDPNGNVVTGQIPVGSLGGDQYATGGSVTLTSSLYPSLDGTYALSVPASPPTVYTSPSGQFVWDNVFHSSGPLLDFYGLFGISSSGVELNLFSGNGGVGYALYALVVDPINGNTQYNLYPGPANAGFSNNGGTGAVVPEASTIVAGVLMLLPFGVSTVRIMRKNVMS